METVANAQEALKHIKLRTLVVGEPGSGKTHFLSTCPKTYVMVFSRGEEDTFLVKPELSKNIVGFDRFIPNDAKDTKLMFGDNGMDNGAIHKALKMAKEMYKEGKIETLAIDTVTYLADYIWIYINEFEKKMTSSGELDTRGMYGSLKTKLEKLVGLNICSFPGNLILTSHEQLETEEAMAKKADKSNPIVANITGSYRNKIAGQFSSVIYLSKINKQGGGYSFWARTDKGQGKSAKSRLPLPEKIENISYQTIMGEIQKAINPTKS